MNRIWQQTLCALCLAACAALVACGGGGGADGGTGGGGGGATPPLSGDYYPLAVGDRWFFRVDSIVTTTHVIGTRDTPFGPATVVRSEDQDGVSENLMQRTSDGVWSLPPDPTDPVGAALGRYQLLRLPLVPGDSYETLDRTLPNIEDFNGDGRPDTLRVVLRVTVMGPEALTMAGRNLSNVLRLRTEITQTITFAGDPEPLTGQSVVEEWLAPDIGVVASHFTTRVDGRLVDASSASGIAWRVGGRPSETLAPRVLSVSPADGSLQQRATLRVTFSEAMDRFTAAARALVLVDSSGAEVPATLRWLSDSELELQPTAPLASGVWQPRLGTSMQDMAGNLLTTPSAWRFTIDASGPRVVGKSPAPDSVNVAINSVVRVVFDEPLGDIDVRPNMLYVSWDSGRPVSGTVTKEGDRTLVFTPTAGLPPGQRVHVGAGGALDSLGNSAPREDWDFDVERGRFAAAVELPGPFGGTGAFSVRASGGDSDGNGRAELLTSSRAPSAPFTATHTLYRLSFGADGTLGSPEPLQTLALDCTTSGLALADLDGDGVRDAVVSSTSVAGSACGLHWLRGTAGGGFATPAALHLGGGGAAQVLPHAAHGRPTLVMPLDDARLLVLRQGDTPGVWLAPQYVSTATTSSSGALSRTLETGDVNGDGRVDVVVMAFAVGSQGLERQVFLQAADGTLGEAIRNFQAGTASTTTMALSDLNGDLRDDLVLELGQNLVWMAAGVDGAFGEAQILANTNGGRGPRFADIDGDGRRDLIFSDLDMGLRAMLRVAGGGLGPVQTLHATSRVPNTSRLVVADFDGDGLADMAIDNYWLRQRPPTAAAVTATGPARAAAAAAVVVPADTGRRPAALMRPGMGRLTPPTELLRRARPPAALEGQGREGRVR